VWSLRQKRLLAVGREVEAEAEFRQILELGPTYHPSAAPRKNRNGAFSRPAGLDQPTTFGGKYSLNSYAPCLILVDTHRPALRANMSETLLDR
jgi:hypothetical protein